MRMYVTVLAAALVLAACSSTATTDGSATGQVGGGDVNSAVSQRPVDGWSNTDAGAVQDLQQNVGDRVFFGYDRFDVSAEAQAVLKLQAAWLQSNSKLTITVEGHADERGTREYNIALGERRAAAVKNYLTSLGVAESRIRTLSYGEERPSVVGSNEEAWAANRRAVTVIDGAM